LFFRIVENAIPILEIVGGRSAGMGAVRQSVTGGFAGTVNPQVCALHLDNEAIVFKLMEPFAYGILVSVKLPGAVPRRQEHRVLSLGVVVLSQF
jgi:hypothetical protein